LHVILGCFHTKSHRHDGHKLFMNAQVRSTIVREFDQYDIKLISTRMNYRYEIWQNIVTKKYDIELTLRIWHRTLTNACDMELVPTCWCKCYVTYISEHTMPFVLVSFNTIFASGYFLCALKYIMCVTLIINYLDVILHGFMLQLIYTTVFRVKRLSNLTLPRSIV
jgi:hypothetical protein